MAKIKLVCTDLDGCLTDGTVQYRSDGTTSRSFSVIDGAGFALLNQRGIDAVVITSSIGNDIDIRMKHLRQHTGIKSFMGVRDKAELLLELMADMGVDAEEVAYLGDDTNDLAAMSMCGVIGCPTTARTQILDLVMQTKKKRAVVVGFPHAFRGFVDWLIEKNYV